MPQSSRPFPGMRYICATAQIQGMQSLCFATSRAAQPSKITGFFAIFAAAPVGTSIA
jgi:hypothetical protein